MDPEFLEFWGNYLVNLSRLGKLSDPKGFRQEALRFWQSLMGDRKESGIPRPPSGYFERQWELFCRCYGLREKNNEPDYYDFFRRASEAFQKSFTDLMESLQFIPRAEYDQVKNKYEQLKEKIKIQDETIQQLKTKKLFEAAEGFNVTSGIQDLVRIQTEQFATLMDSLGNFYGWGKKAKQKS